MKKVFITGISGTGKTTIARELNSRGIYSISVDEVEGLCHWENKSTKIKVDYDTELNKEFIEAHEWMCDIDFLKRLLQEKPDVVVLGSTENQNEFLNLFDKILLLQCSPETFIKRLVGRTDNDFGKDKGAQELILSWYKEFESKLLKKGAVSIDVEKPLEEVVESIIKEIQ